MVLVVSFGLALVATPAAMALARRVGLLDHPGDLKVQTEAIPYLGGLGVAAGLAVGVAVAQPRLLVPLALALVLGVADDARHISPGARLSAEVVVALTAAAILPVRLPWALGAVAVTVVVLLLVNGVNMIDGLDALAAGVALMSALGFALALDGDARSVALALAGGLLGFLAFNRPPAKVYMGDGGAYLVGAALALLVGLAWSEDLPLAVSAGSLLFVACPVAELGFAVLRRIRSRSRLFAGDRGHVYDQLVDRGWSRNQAVGAYVLAQALLTAVGVGAGHVSTEAAWIATAACGVALLVTVAALGFLASPRRETAA